MVVVIDREARGVGADEWKLVTLTLTVISRLMAAWAKKSCVISRYGSQ